MESLAHTRRFLGGGRPEPPADGAADLELIGALGRREERAVAQVHDLYGGLVGRYLRATLGDAGEAEDVMQQVMIEVWQRGPQYDPRRGSLLTWIMTIARSRAIDNLRRRVPEPRDPTLRSTDAEAAAADGVDELIDRWRLADLLAHIPREEAEALRLRFYGGLAQPEIAERMGLPLGTVKTRMVAGLVRLREMLAEEPL